MHASKKYSKSLKYAKDKYAKRIKYANTFLIAKYAKHSRSTLSVFYELVPVELVSIVFSFSKRVFAFFACT